MVNRSLIFLFTTFYQCKKRGLFFFLYNEIIRLHFIGFTDQERHRCMKALCDQSQHLYRWNTLAAFVSVIGNSGKSKSS